MTAAVVTLALAIAGALAAIVSLALGRVSDTKSLSKQFTDERVEHANTRTKLERRDYELDVTQKALVAANKRAAALEEVLNDEVNRSPNPDLARDDVRSRILRIARQWSEAADARNPLPAATSGAVPEGTAADAAEPAGVHAEHDPDGLMQPDAT
jgi:hypothetical protein